MPSLIPTPESEPPSEKQIREAVYVFVGYRQGRAMKITRQALEDGLARGCLRWFYYVVPAEYAQEGRTRRVTAWDRTLVIERKYLPVDQGITTEWNAWCERWGVPAMQVFTPAQKEQRIAEGKQVVWTDPGESKPAERPVHLAGSVGDPADDPEVETAIIAASAEHDLDLGEPDPVPTSAQCAYCSAGAGEQCDAECSCLPCSKQRMMLAAAHLVFPQTPQSGAPRESAPAPPRVKEKKFWEDE